MNEGYIKFTPICVSYEYPKESEIADLQVLRNYLKSRNLIGCLPDGIGFGNVSKRFGDKFIISASQTGGINLLLPEHYVYINEFSISKNNVYYSGIGKPSSESLTHLAIYENKHNINIVAHFHNNKIWEKLIQTGKKTSGNADYGTIEIALEASEYVSRNSDLCDIFALNGHKDGIIAYSDNLVKILELIDKYVD